MPPACTADGSGITYNANINVALAVAMPDGGLITPVLKNADTTDIYQLSRWGRGRGGGGGGEQQCRKGGRARVPCGQRKSHESGHPVQRGWTFMGYPGMYVEGGSR